MKHLTKRNLTYDLLVLQNQLTSAIRLVDAHPHQRFILDHCAKPEISSKFPVIWATHIKELARRENVFCKISGLTTEVRENSWDIALLRPYFETVLEAFGSSRLMFGSDWPVCLLRTDYSRWINVTRELTSSLSRSEQEDIFSNSAIRAYNLPSSSGDNKIIPHNL